MSLAQLHVEIVARCPILVAANPAAFAGDPPWVALSGPVRRALADAGYPSSGSVPADADLAGLPAASYEQVVETSTLAALRDASTGAVDADVRAAATAALAARSPIARDRYGTDAGTIRVGRINLGCTGT